MYQALYELVANAQINGQPAFITTSRKFRYWTEVPGSMQPAFYQQEPKQLAVSTNNYGETMWHLEAILWIYNQHDPNDEVYPSTFINNVLDAIETALMPDPSGRQTLGGLVEHCYIDGEIPIDEGTIPSDIQSVVMIPIKITTGV